MQNTTYTQSPQTIVNNNTTEIPELPTLASGVQLVGELPETGFAEKQWLAVRNGKFIQLGELLYRVAELVNGQRTLDEIAQRMTETTEWTVTAEHVQKILEKMIPLGIIAPEGGSKAFAHQEEPARNAKDSTLGITMRTQVIGPHIIQPIARVLQVFYRPALLIPLLIIMAVAHSWLYLGHGISIKLLEIPFARYSQICATAIMMRSGMSKAGW